MGKLKELQDQLLAELEPAMAEYGFVERGRGRTSFYKRTDIGRLAFHIAFAQYDTVVDASADVAVRMDALEGLVNEYQDDLSEKEKKQTFTVGAELGNIRSGNYKYWRISKSSQIPKVARKIMKMFKSVGKPYLDKYADPERMYHALCDNGPSSWLVSIVEGDRCGSAVALAFLLRKDDDENGSTNIRREPM